MAAKAEVAKVAMAAVMAIEERIMNGYGCVDLVITKKRIGQNWILFK